MGSLVDTQQNLERLRTALAQERAKRAKLCELFLFAIGIDPASLEPGNGFLDALVRNTAEDLDVLCAALGAAAAEDPRTPEVVSRIADRLKYGQLAAAQVRELLDDVRLMSGVPLRSDNV